MEVEPLRGILCPRSTVGPMAYVMPLGNPDVAPGEAAAAPTDGIVPHARNMALWAAISALSSEKRLAPGQNLSRQKWGLTPVR